MDYLVRGTAADLMIRAFAVDATETVEEARLHHDTRPWDGCQIEYGRRK